MGRCFQVDVEEREWTIELFYHLVDEKRDPNHFRDLCQAPLRMQNTRTLVLFHVRNGGCMSSSFGDEQHDQTPSLHVRLPVVEKTPGEESKSEKVNLVHPTVTLYCDSLGRLEQWMITADDLAQVQSHIGYLVIQDPAQVQEGRGIADDPLCLADRSVPVVLHVLGGHLVGVEFSSREGD